MPTSQEEEVLSRSWNIVEALATRMDSVGGRMAVMIAAVFLCIAAGYLIGSINPAILISRRVFHQDIRESGSGNAGTTNVLRTYGKKYAVITLALDMFKAAVPVLLGYLLYGTVGAPIAGFFCIFGHMFPLYYHFRGGKGFATAFFSILALNPLIFLILCFIFFPLVLTTHYVSLGSIVTMWMYSLITSAFDSAFGTHYGINTIVAFLIAVLVTWTHRANIRRIMNRTENKSYFFRKKEKAPAPEDDKKHDAQ